MFLGMLAANPRLDAKKRAAAATQMLPRLVCFIHNVVQVPAALAVLASPAFYAYPDRMAAATAYSTLVMAVSAGAFVGWVGCGGRSNAARSLHGNVMIDACSTTPIKHNKNSTQNKKRLFCVRHGRVPAAV
jgi:hypothetical protein